VLRRLAGWIALNPRQATNGAPPRRVIRTIEGTLFVGHWGVSQFKPPMRQPGYSGVVILLTILPAAERGHHPRPASAAGCMPSFARLLLVR
jgi:hypothetical protein